MAAQTRHVAELPMAKGEHRGRQKRNESMVAARVENVKGEALHAVQGNHGLRDGSNHAVSAALVIGHVGDVANDEVAKLLFISII